MAVKRKPGRPTDYKPEFLAKAAKMWAKGATDAEVAESLKKSPETLRQWCGQHPEFLAAKKEAKALADELVEQALFKRATGVVLPDCHVSMWEGHVTITPLLKHYPPDPVSMIFWLKNRKPKEWRDRVETHVTGDVVAFKPETIELGRQIVKAMGMHTNGTEPGRT